MTDWRAVLRDGNGDEPMSVLRAQQMRRAVTRAAQAAPRSRVAWPWKLSLAALALAVAAGGAGDRPTTGDPAGGAIVDPPPGERRQLQFASPGGTRIIWELNPQFTLMETLP
jgi:hypothetical protein